MIEGLEVGIDGIFCLTMKFVFNYCSCLCINTTLEVSNACELDLQECK